jgi:hypothetical protein
MPEYEKHKHHGFQDGPSNRSEPIRAQRSLAGRTAAWTSRGILTAVVLLAGVMFGRQVLRWWAQDDVVPGPTGITTDLLSPSAEPYLLRFGSQDAAVAVRRVDGTQAEAAAALRSLGVDLLPAVPFPTEPAGTEELRFLVKLAKERPVAEAPGQWRLYAVSKDAPLVAGVRCTPAGPASARDDNPAEDRSASRADDEAKRLTRRREGREEGNCDYGERLVLWGIGLPSSPTGWTLYTFLSGGVDSAVPGLAKAEPSGGPEDGLPPIPLPPGAEPILSLCAAGNGRLATFGGLVELGSWRVFFDRWFGRHGWTADGGWRKTATGWHARFRAAGGGEETLGRDVVDVHLSRDPQGRARGLVVSEVGSMR